MNHLSTDIEYAQRSAQYDTDAKLALLLANEDLSSSVETVKASTLTPTPTLEVTPAPLTPFPPWKDNEGHDDARGEPLRSVRTGGSSTVSPREMWDDQAEAEYAFGEMTRAEQSMRRTVMNGVVLAVQSFGLLAGFSVLVWVTIWQRADITAEFWDWLGLPTLLSCS